MERIYDPAVQDFEEEHIRAVRELGGECTVLLRKDGSFPLPGPGRIAALGAGVRGTLIGGTGSGEVNVRHFVTVEEGLQRAGFTIVAAEEADTAIYVLTRNSGEGTDRKAESGDIELTEAEIRDILAANDRYRRFMLVMNVCGLVDLTPVAEVKNILLLGQLGIPTGDILADLLLGKTCPSGKLAMTWAPIDAYPSTEGFGDPDDTEYREGIYVGYRHFRTAGVPCLWPFGYGLGYTEFRVEPMDVAADEAAVTAEVRVTNTGGFSGKEVIQLYVSAPQGRLDKPALELRGFAKTGELLPGESEVLQITCRTADMASYDEDSAAWVLEQGDYHILIGTDCENAKPAGVLRLDEDATIRRRKASDCDAPAELPPGELPPGDKALWDEVLRGEKTIAQFVSGLTVPQLTSLCTGFHEETDSSPTAKSLDGAAGETTDRLAALGVPSITMADGPAGLRLSPTACDEEGRTYYQYCTAIPVATALAQSWNPGLCQRCGDIVGEEMERFGADLWLAPAQNIQRSPLCGRNFEYMSEDPLLSGICAGSLVKGVQGHPGCGATVKHFCCNNQETNRFRSNSIVSERALREIYLKTFEVSMGVCEPAAVMTSYNLVNGEHTCNNRELVTHVLREEWGFRGLVMTDWCVTTGDTGEVCRAHRHDIASAAGCVKAGNDITMPGARQDEEDMQAALANREHPYHLEMAELQLAAMRVLRAIQKGDTE